MDFSACWLALRRKTDKETALRRDWPTAPQQSRRRPMRKAARLTIVVPLDVGEILML